VVKRGTPSGTSVAKPTEGTALTKRENAEPATRTGTIESAGGRTDEEHFGESDQGGSVRTRSVTQRRTLVVQRYTSPLPPAAELEKLKKVGRDLPDRLVGIIEKEQGRRHGRERANELLSARGQIFGFVLFLAVLALAAFCVEKGQEEIAIALLVGDGLAAAVGVAGVVLQRSGKKALPPADESDEPDDDDGAADQP
jgi:uncharacterized membrane protein